MARLRSKSLAVAVRLDLYSICTTIATTGQARVVPRPTPPPSPPKQPKPVQPGPLKARVEVTSSLTVPHLEGSSQEDTYDRFNPECMKYPEVC